LSQVPFFDKRVRPHAFHQIFFGNDVATVFDERQKDVEDLWSKRNEFAVAQQNTLRPIQVEATELITTIVLLPHKKRPLRNIIEEI
jgi:hypothetical protein